MRRRFRGHTRRPAVSRSTIKDDVEKPVFCLIVPWLALGGADRCGLDLMSHYKGRGFRISVISTRKMPCKDSLRTSAFLSLADDVFYEENVADIVKELQPVYTVVNNSHEAYDQARAIKIIPMRRMIKREQLKKSHQRQG